ncbi:hypothetical protein [Frigidibacter albus]|nr:hypothetical protein [Frigidibacter albus]
MFLDLPLFAANAAGRRLFAGFPGQGLAAQSAVLVNVFGVL